MNEIDYNISQAALYLVTPLLLTSLENELAQFSALQARYSPAYITAVQNKLAACQAIPDEEQRNELHERKRLLLVTESRDCLKKFRSVKIFIKTAYGEDAEMYIASAGGNYYDSAQRYNWKSVKQLNVECLKFLNDHKTELLANDNMPSTFIGEYEAASELFRIDMMEFYNKVTESRVLTAAKITANNELYAYLMEICEAGRHIFENDELLRKQFTFDAIVELISPATAAAARITVLNKETNLPMVGVLITLKNTDKTASTNADGVAIMSQLEADKLFFIVEADGFKAKEVPAQMKAGVETRVKVELEALFEPIVESVDEPVAEPGATPEPVEVPVS